VLTLFGFCVFLHLYCKVYELANFFAIEVFCALITPDDLESFYFSKVNSIVYKCD